LMRDSDRTVIRHVPSELEYWLSTTAPEENLKFHHSVDQDKNHYQKSVVKFVARQKEVQ
jgi:hypothetical protein